MTTAGNSNAALLLLTGLLSVSMAAIGYYYLHSSSNKSVEDGEDAGVYNDQKTKKTAAAPVETAPASPKTIEIPKKVVQKTVESPDMKVEAIAVEKDVVAESPKQEADPPVLELPKTAHLSPKQTPEIPKEEVESTAAELSKLGEPKTPESPKKVMETPTEKQATCPKKVEPVTRKLSEDFFITQAVSETAAAFTEELVQESLENVALEQEEYVQVDLTQSMTLSQSTPELINVEDAGVKNEEEEVARSAATEEEESIVEDEQEQVAVEAVEPKRAEPVVEAVVVPETTALASLKSPREPPASWEAIASSPVVTAITPADEPATPLSLDTPVESTETEESLSISVPDENTEAAAEDKDAASSPVSSGSSSPGSRRNRNRSKKSKSKKKKGKKKFKA